VSFAVRVEAVGHLAAEVEIVWVAVERARHQPVPLPAATRDWLAGYTA
jgi:acyl-CoA thioester hydrolase